MHPWKALHHTTSVMWILQKQRKKKHPRSQSQDVADNQVVSQRVEEASVVKAGNEGQVDIKHIF